uniref:Uncharacterized protein n=1 Tax=Rhizophora mucronata TaxID=61149 RepID=A0A2P2P018_RHIMU
MAICSLVSHLSKPPLFPCNTSPKLPCGMCSYTSKLVSLLETNASNLTIFLCLILPNVSISAERPLS